MREAITKERKLAHSEQELLWAAEVRRLSKELAELVVGGKACGSCARDCDGAEGAYAGGLCCAGPTSYVFDDDEVSLLSLSQLPASSYRGPRGGSAGGCAFRGPMGCSLRVEARPAVCIHYICRELMAELAGDGLAEQVGQVQEQLEEAMVQFRLARQARLADQE